jgi:flagellar biogenesis protein FliO
VSHQKKKIVFLCLLLVVSGGWIALASRQTTIQKTPDGGQKTEDSAAVRSPSAVLRDPPSFLNDPRLPASGGGSLGNGELFFRMMLSVGLIIGLGTAALYLSKRVLPKVGHAPGKEIHVLETAYLGPRKALHLVEIGGRRLLIASTNDCITMLASVQETWSDLSSQEFGEAVKT